MSVPVSSIHMDNVHCSAICDEIGFRLGQLLRIENSVVPRDLELLLARLRQQDYVEAPSIVPSIAEMELLEDA